MQSPSAFLNRLILELALRAGRIAGFVARHRGWIQGIAGVIAFVLGFWGWTIKEPPADFSGVMNNLFRTLQLITLQFPTEFGGTLPWSLQIARLAVPLVAVLASFQVLIGSVTRPARLALLPHASGHIVVCGSETLTEAALIGLAQRRRQVVVVVAKVEATRRSTLEGLGLTIVERDPLQTATMKSLNVSRAAALFLTADDDVANLNIAMLALPATRTRPPELPPLVLAVLIEREDLAVELDAALDGLSRRHGVRYHRLCPDREGVLLELARFAPVWLKDDLDAPSHVLVAGLAGNWRQIAAQIIVATQDHLEKLPALTFLVDKGEAEAVERWRATTPELSLVVEIAVLTRQADDVLPSGDTVSSWHDAHVPPQLAVVLRKDADAIATMLALRRPGSPFRTDAIPILVRQSKEDRLLSRLGETEVRDRDMTRLVAFGGLVRAESIERVLDRRGDEMAIALHTHYLNGTQRLGAGSPAALEAWDDLPENLRDANRAAAEHAPILFAAAGLQIVNGAADIKSVTLSCEELECLARVEHRRWIADRINRGWRYGKVRDDLRMLHPDLVPYEMLSEMDREKDRNSVRTLLSILARQGLVITPKPQR